MKLVLEELAHQEEALNAIVKALDECRFNYHNDLFVNTELEKNKSEPFFIDVKMETGTGKTYVYTQTMFELHKRYGINKFIVFVPSLAIKEGTKNFIESDYTVKHFASIYDNVHIDLDYINAGDFNTKKGRKTIPAKLMEFLEATRNDKKTVQCLLLNDDMLTSSSMTRNDYDQTLLFSTSCPLEAIKMVKPIVIIDEPHRFHEDTKSWKKIQELDPQIILRFGATFPVKKSGRGRNRKVETDYKNLVYDLNTIDSFNRGLVKFIDVQYPESISWDQSKNIYNVKSINDKQLIICNTITNTTHTLQAGDILPSVFSGGIRYDGMKKLSNGLELHKGMDLIPEIHTARSYQELLIQQALNAHFKSERENWVREGCGENPAKIKTLSLFFIEDISSYRPHTENAETWLKDTFEKLLKEKLKQLIENETLPDYKDFLKDSLCHIPKTHAGYFAEDSSKKGEEAIQEQVDKILRRKEKLLSFKDKNGKWELCRFLFSKWTLKEGWDNPNVFTITKLRTSGSEISKIQEVGRGLRLPVDENGRRISDQEFRLNFIIDWSEKGFAARLLGEINANIDSNGSMKLTPDILETLVKSNYAANTAKAKGKLLLDDIVDEDDNIIGISKLEELLPGGWGTLNRRAVTINSKVDNRVKLRRNNWEKLRNLWQQVVMRYMIRYDELEQSELENILKNAVKDVFITNYGEIVIQEIHADKNHIYSETRRQATDMSVGILSYGKFLHKLSEQTNVNVNLLNKVLCSVYPHGIEKDKFNDVSLYRIINNFKKEFSHNFAQKFRYDYLDFSANTSLIKDGDFVDSIPQNILGVNEDPITPQSNYLYDKIVYDSEPEKNILHTKPQEEVVVFGKLPKSCIKVPKYTGGTTSPDFIYAIRQGENIKVNLFVEAKPDNKRDSDKEAVRSQKRFFEKMHDLNIEWREILSDQSICNVINDLLKNSSISEKR